MNWMAQIFIVGAVLITAAFALSILSIRILPLIKREQVYKEALAFFWHDWAVHKQYLGYLNVVRITACDVQAFRKQLQDLILQLSSGGKTSYERLVGDQQVKNIQELIARLQLYMESLLKAGSDVFKVIPSLDAQAKLFADGCAYSKKEVLDQYTNEYLPLLEKVVSASNTVSNDIIKNGVESTSLDEYIRIYSGLLDELQALIFKKMVPAVREASQRSHVTWCVVWLIDKMASLLDKKI